MLWAEDVCFLDSFQTKQIFFCRLLILIENKVIRENIKEQTQKNIERRERGRLVGWLVVLIL
jgi:hypothetical protein